MVEPGGEAYERLLEGKGIPNDKNFLTKKARGSRA
jgi:hypothetical protein